MGPRTLPHMLDVLTNTFLKTEVKHYILNHTIDFKTWLEPYADNTLASLSQSLELRVAMAPYRANVSTSSSPSSSGAHDDRLPILQGKACAREDFEYAPPLGVKPLKARPTFAISPVAAAAGSSSETDTSVLLLCETRPLFCAHQPKRKVFVLNEDGVTYAKEADGHTPRVKYVDIASADMDCKDFLKSLDKLKEVIQELQDSETFFSTDLIKYPQHTPENMIAWWSTFDETQRAIIMDPNRRRPKNLNMDTDPSLFAAFDSVILRHKLDEQARHLWLTRQCDAALRMRTEERIIECSYSEEGLHASFNCPTTATAEVAEYDDLREMLKGVLPETPTYNKHKPFLVLSCGTDRKAIDDFAGYFGPGPKDKKSPLLWAWVCEVQEVVEHSTDWTKATVRVHWYRPAYKSRKQWVCAFWEKGSTAHGTKTVVWDVDAPNDPAYWYMEDYEIKIDQVIAQFESWHEEGVAVKDASQQVVRGPDGKILKTKGCFLPKNIQRRCDDRCKQLHNTYTTQAGSSGATIAHAVSELLNEGAEGRLSVTVPESVAARTPIGDTIHRDGSASSPTSISPTTSLANLARGMLADAGTRPGEDVEYELVAGKYLQAKVSKRKPASSKHATHSRKKAKAM